MRPRYWIEQDGVPVPTDMMTWARSKEGLGYRVAKTTRGDGEIVVSAVFLGLDHNSCPNGPPLIYETMVFGLDEDEHCERYSTREAAQAGHQRAVEETDAALLALLTHAGRA